MFCLNIQYSISISESSAKVSRVISSLNKGISKVVVHLKNSPSSGTSTEQDIKSIKRKRANSLFLYINDFFIFICDAILLEIYVQF